VSVKYKKTRSFGCDRYDARVGMLWVGTQDNGEGWWNWWVALAEQGPAAGDHAIVESGGCPTLASAQERIATECELVARRILGDL
jgi:hypothetical protein